MSFTDLSLPSSSEVRVRASSFSFHSIFDFEPRKSKRVAISFEPCWTAFNTSCRSTLLTTSNENSWAMGALYFGRGSAFSRHPELRRGSRGRRGYEPGRVECRVPLRRFARRDRRALG